MEQCYQLVLCHTSVTYFCASLFKGAIIALSALYYYDFHCILYIQDSLLLACLLSTIFDNSICTEQAVDRTYTAIH